MKQVVYLFSDIPLEIIVIDRKGKILSKEAVAWKEADKTLRFVRLMEEK